MWQWDTIGGLMSRARRVFLTCYAASGMAALVYQVAWTRLFSLELGHTTAAATRCWRRSWEGWRPARGSAVMSAADASPRLLNMYAALELCIAAIAVVLPSALRVLDRLNRLGVSTTAPTFCNPARSCQPSHSGLGRRDGGDISGCRGLAGGRGADEASPRPLAATAGALYAANTAGAAIGAIGAGFWSILAIGLRATTWIGIVLNIAARPEPSGSRAARMHGRSASEDPSTRGRRFRPQRSLVPCSHQQRPHSPVFWRSHTRSRGPDCLPWLSGPRPTLLPLWPHPSSSVSPQARSWGHVWHGGPPIRRRGSESTLVLTAVSAPVAAWYAASRLPILVAAYVNAGAPFESIMRQQVLAAATVLLPTSVALGASFVMAVAAATGGTDAIGKDAARIDTAQHHRRGGGRARRRLPADSTPWTAINLRERRRVRRIRGNTLSSPLQSFRRAAARAMLGSRQRWSSRWLPLSSPFQGWDRELLASGAYKYSRNVDLECSTRRSEPESSAVHKEGAAGTVSVRRVAGTRALAIDGKVDASNAGDMLTQRLLGLLPVLLHPGPRDALVIGLGSGVTADAVLASGEIQQVDIVELSPEVVEASAYFERENHSRVDQSARTAPHRRRPHARAALAPGGMTSSFQSHPIPGWRA